jgi:hypothetical protein
MPLFEAQDSRNADAVGIAANQRKPIMKHRASACTSAIAVVAAFTLPAFAIAARTPFSARAQRSVHSSQHRTDAPGRGKPVLGIAWTSVVATKDGGPSSLALERTVGPRIVKLFGPFPKKCTASASVSFDGRWLVYGDVADRLHLVNLRSHKQRVIAFVGGGYVPLPPAFSADSRYVAYVQEDSSFNVHWDIFDTRTGSRTRVPHVEGQFSRANRSDKYVGTLIR